VPATVASEKAAMVAYCTANNITYTEHASGILYEIMAPGLGSQPTLTNTVATVYTGKLLNNTQFDASANPVSFLLNGVIKGWQIAIPLIRKGGRIKMVIPSSLAYGCNGSGSIPPNSPLYFEVTLTDVR
jgi:FKBP-type peptidyl-prolyl cis-trans isomerase